MRRATSLLLAALPPCVSLQEAATGDGGLEQRWRAWKRAFAPTPYSSEDAARGARAAFAGNDRAILAHNARGDSSWTLGHNQFSGLTPEQFASQHTLASPLTPPTGLPPHELATNDPTLPRAPPAANSSHDWSEHGVVAPVQQQGSCGGCWAFATSAAMESALAIATQQPVQKLSEEDLIECELVVVDLFAVSLANPKSVTRCASPPNVLCAGGDMYKTYQWMQWAGIVNESWYPYSSAGGSASACHNGADPTTNRWQRQAAWNAGGVFGFSTAPHDATEAHMLQALAKQPISTAINPRKLMSYKGGVCEYSDGPSPRRRLTQTGAANRR